MTPLPATHQGPSALDTLVHQRAPLPFAWGLRDCAMWAFDAVQATTGRDPAADLRGAYRTAGQALRLLRSLGGLQALATARFGAAVPLATAGDGAVVLLKPTVCAGSSAGHGALGVLWRGLVVAQGDLGLVWVPKSAALACWEAAAWPA